jgi:hypothetical protein
LNSWCKRVKKQHYFCLAAVVQYYQKALIDSQWMSDVSLTRNKLA